MSFVSNSKLLSSCIKYQARAFIATLNEWLLLIAIFCCTLNTSSAMSHDNSNTRVIYSLFCWRDLSVCSCNLYMIDGTKNLNRRKQKKKTFGINYVCSVFLKNSLWALLFLLLSLITDHHKNRKQWRMSEFTQVTWAISWKYQSQLIQVHFSIENIDNFFPFWSTLYEKLNRNHKWKLSINFW